MAGVGSEPRDFPSFIREARRRLTALERRLSTSGTPSGGGLPQEILDWDEALTPGRYWSEFLVGLNTPPWSVLADWEGHVEYESPSGDLIQTARPATSAGQQPTFIRRRVGGVWQGWVYVDATAALPQPQRATYSVLATVTVGAGSWQDMPGASPLSFGSLPAPLLVEAHFQAIAVSTSTAYAMIGVVCVGGLSLPCLTDYWTSATEDYSHSPFSNLVGNVHIAGTKQFVIPAQTPVTQMHMQMRRSAVLGTQQANYSKMEINPIRWM